MISLLLTLIIAVVSAAGQKCTPSFEKGKLHVVDVAVEKVQRKMLLYIPKSRRDGEQGPGMISFHGFHSNPWADVVQLMNQTRYAEQYGFSLAIPFGTSLTFPNKFCCAIGYTAETCADHTPVEDTWDSLRPCAWKAGFFDSAPTLKDIDDLALARAVGKELTKSACVDQSRLFVLGFSDGSVMANKIACEAADVFKGIVAISGSWSYSSCKPSKPLSYMGFCGTADSICFPGASSAFEFWAKHNYCTGEVKETLSTSTTKCVAYTGCPDGLLVERCLLIGMDDQVPGHNRTAPFGKMPYQPLTNVDSIDYSFKHYASLSSGVNSDNIFIQSHIVLV